VVVVGAALHVVVDGERSVGVVGAVDDSAGDGDGGVDGEGGGGPGGIDVDVGGQDRLDRLDLRRVVTIGAGASRDQERRSGEAMRTRLGVM
jgi:hypothetical protein